MQPTFGWFDGWAIRCNTIIALVIGYELDFIDFLISDMGSEATPPAPHRHQYALMKSEHSPYRGRGCGWCKGHIARIYGAADEYKPFGFQAGLAVFHLFLVHLNLYLWLLSPNRSVFSGVRMAWFHICPSNGFRIIRGTFNIGFLRLCMCCGLRWSTWLGLGWARQTYVIIGKHLQSDGDKLSNSLHLIYGLNR